MFFVGDGVYGIPLILTEHKNSFPLMPRGHFLSARLQKGSKEKLKGNSDFPSDRKGLYYKKRFGNTPITETQF